jgi:hypothetical protein
MLPASSPSFSTIATASVFGSIGWHGSRAQRSGVPGDVGWGLEPDAELVARIAELCVSEY